MFSIVPSGFRSSPLSFLGSIWFSIWTWHSVIVYIQLILKYLTLFSSSINSSSSLSTPASWSFCPWSIMADLVIYGIFLFLDLISFFLCLSLFQPLPGTTFEYGRMYTAEGSPYSHWMDLWQVRTTVAQAISIPGFLSMAVACSSGYGCTLETAVIAQKQSNLRGCPRFPHPRWCWLLS
jgi:hypothetical protein